MEETKMKTMMFEIYPNDDYSCPTRFVKYNVRCDADIDDLIIMLSEQGFHVADVYDAEDFDWYHCPEHDVKLLIAHPTDVGAYYCYSICGVAHYYNQHEASIVKLF